MKEIKGEFELIRDLILIDSGFLRFCENSEEPVIQ